MLCCAHCQLEQGWVLCVIYKSEDLNFWNTGSTRKSFGLNWRSCICLPLWSLLRILSGDSTRGKWTDLRSLKWSTKERKGSQNFEEQSHMLERFPFTYSFNKHNWALTVWINGLGSGDTLHRTKVLPSTSLWSSWGNRCYLSRHTNNYKIITVISTVKVRWTVLDLSVRGVRDVFPRKGIFDVGNDRWIESCQIGL